MYQHQIYHKHPRKMGSYFLPFLSLIIIGLIVVLVFQIVGYFQQKRLAALENKAAIEIVTGRAEMKIWGVDQWTKALNGGILNEGDLIRTAPGSRVILTLLNGSVIRLNSETQVELTGLKTKDSQDEVTLTLSGGEVWLKRTENEAVRTSFQVTTPHLVVNSLGTIFDVSKGSDETLRVLNGKVQAVVMVPETDSETMRVAETLEVALGQEINIGQGELFDLQNRKPVNLLSLLADEFRNGDWYVWNRNEDASGSSGVSVADAVNQKQNTEDAVTVPVISVVEPEPVPVDLSFITPEILSPKPEERTVTGDSVVIAGTVGPKTVKVEVTTYVAGKPESYALSRYKAGSTSWSYVASRQYANFVPGENRYTIVAIDKEGKRSEPAEITIIYDKVVEPADLVAPKIIGFNDESASGSSYSTDSDSVKVAGTIGKGIVKVIVNDFALSAYVPDSGKWVYYAKTIYRNLDTGKNSYSVYGIDAAGNKTSITEFSINKTEALQAPVPLPPVILPATIPAL